MLCLLAVGIIVVDLFAQLLCDRLDFSLTRQVIVFEPAMLPPFVTISGGCVVLFLGVCWGFPSAESSKRIRTGIEPPENKKNRLRNWMLGICNWVICFLFLPADWLFIYNGNEMNMKNISFLDKQERSISSKLISPITSCRIGNGLYRPFREKIVSPMSCRCG